MSDVRETDTPAQEAAQARGRPLRGSHIWYELMTTDPEGAKAFYDAVVGWDIQPPHDAIGYRMIRRSDGGSAGGVLPMGREMIDHGARPGWFAYIGVDDVDGAVAEVEAKGGRTLMPGRDIDKVGRIAMVADPQGAPFYVMKPIPPEGEMPFSGQRM
ncbi:MAG TPA: VOC family protein, partial [Sphingomicrobium sp.]|nr:VOC family protein [Sphingomicrobium sp.]